MPLSNVLLDHMGSGGHLHSHNYHIQMQYLLHVYSLRKLAATMFLFFFKWINISYTSMCLFTLTRPILWFAAPAGARIFSLFLINIHIWCLFLSKHQIGGLHFLVLFIKVGVPQKPIQYSFAVVLQTVFCYTHTHTHT